MRAKYAGYLRGIEVQSTPGYFGIDKKGLKVDSSVKRGSSESDDISAYNLILKDKSACFPSTPMRFMTY